jgi:excisionase family DNA binding protein
MNTAGKLPSTGLPIAADATIEQHFSADAAAKLTGLPKRRLWDFCRRGELRHVRLGRSVLIPASGLKELLARNTVEVPR